MPSEKPSSTIKSLDAFIAENLHPYSVLKNNGFLPIFGVALRCPMTATFRRRSYLLLLILTSYVIHILVQFDTWCVFLL